MKYESQYYGVVRMEDIIEHHGILGMKWGVRRYQNKDGTLTAAGMKRYNTKRAGKPGKSVLTRHTAKMYEKYNLLEPNPSKDQAWDNSFDMKAKGASDREIKRYLKETGVTAAQKRDQRVKKAKDEAKVAYHVTEHAKELMPAYKDYVKAEEKLNALEDDFVKKTKSLDKEFYNQFDAGCWTVGIDDKKEKSKYIENLKATIKANGNVKNTEAYSLAFNQVQLGEDKYGMAYSDAYRAMTNARDAFDEGCRKAAFESYNKNGSRAMDKWFKAAGTKYVDDARAILHIDQMIYRECYNMHEEEKKKR